jgi:DNA-binding MarR family transcriptional regulator
VTRDEQAVLHFFCDNGPTLPVERLADVTVSRGAILTGIVSSLIDQGYITESPTKPPNTAQQLHLTEKGEAYCGALGNIGRFKPK